MCDIANPEFLILKYHSSYQAYFQKLDLSLLHWTEFYALERNVKVWAWQLLKFLVYSTLNMYRLVMNRVSEINPRNYN